MKMISIIELEKYIAGTNIFGIVIGKFYYKKKLCTIILLKVYKNFQVGFYYIILPYGLAVRILVKSGKEFLFNT